MAVGRLRVSTVNVEVTGKAESLFLHKTTLQTNTERSNHEFTIPAAYKTALTTLRVSSRTYT